MSFNHLMKRFDKTTTELQRRVFELLTIKAMTEEAFLKLDTDGLLNLLLEKSMAVAQARIGSVFLVDATQQRFHVIASRGMGFDLSKDAFLEINTSLARSVLSERKPVLVENIETDPRTLKKNDPKYGPPSFLSLPIFANGSLIAVMNLSHKKTGEVFGQDDEHILSIMITEIGFALDNARLHASREESIKQLKRQTRQLGNVNCLLQREISGRKKVQETLTSERNRLKEALAKVKTLSGFIPICAACKKIRDDKGYWNQIESYIREHSDAEFSHSICPDCKKKLYADLAVAAPHAG